MVQLWHGGGDFRRLRCRYVSIFSMHVIPSLTNRLGSFLPVTLEQLAREVGVLWSNKTTPCRDVASKLRVARSLGASVFRREDNQCIISPFGHDITTSSFSLYTFSIATFVQAITLVSFGSFADHGGVVQGLFRRSMTETS